MRAVTLLTLLAACNAEYDLKADPEPVAVGDPVIEVAPREVVYSTLLEGETEVRAVTIANVGDAPLNVLGLSIDQPALAFSVIGIATPLDLDPGEKIDVDVVYTADGTDAAGLLHVGSNDPVSPDVTVSLLGATEVPLLELDPPTYDYGPQAVGCEVVGVVTARSVGTAPVTIDLAEIAAPFVLDPPGLPVTLDPGQELPLVITYTPGSGGFEDAELIVLSDSAGGPVVGELVGEAVPPDPVIDLFETFPIATEPVYIHDPYDVYAWDPATNTTTFIASSPSYLVDIAIDFDGYLIGLASGGELLRIDPATALTTSWLSPAAYGNALTVLPDNRIIEAAGSTIYEIDRKTGVATAVLNSTNGSSSGDITEVGGTLMWTVGGDSLVAIDPSTWTDSLVGPTGESGLWGLAWPDGELWAFSSAGEAHQLDPGTAAVLDTVVTGVSAYGAAHNPRYGEPQDFTFDLTEQPIEDTIQAFVDGVVAGGWLYLADDNAVWFPDGTLAGGEDVEIHYEVEPECK